MSSLPVIECTGRNWSTLW